MVLGKLSIQLQKQLVISGYKIILYLLRELNITSRIFFILTQYCNVTVKQNLIFHYIYIKKINKQEELNKQT